MDVPLYVFSIAEKVINMQVSGVNFCKGEDPIPPVLLLPGKQQELMLSGLEWNP